jgi:hypothetical protein
MHEEGERGLHGGHRRKSYEESRQPTAKQQPKDDAEWVDRVNKGDGTCAEAELALPHWIKVRREIASEQNQEQHKCRRKVLAQWRQPGAAREAPLRRTGC